MCEMCLGQGCPYCREGTCDECEGTGYIHFVIDPESGERYKCSEEEFYKTPDEYREQELCTTCDGTGKY